MISKHISYKEGVYSITATRLGIDNTPSSKSQHCHGQAMDIDDTFGKATNAEMYHWIKEHLDFDQMIWEFGDDDNPDWVHVSYVSESDNRNRCLRAYRSNGKTVYSVI